MSAATQQVMLGATPGGISRTHTDQIPTMTSGTTSGVTISSDSEYGTPYFSWKAGNKAIANNDCWASTVSPTLPCYLRVDFGSGKAINEFDMQASSEASLAGYMPKTFTFQGSNDASAWTTLLSPANQTAWGTSENRNFLVENATAYRYYQWVISDVNNAIEILLAEVTLKL